MSNYPKRCLVKHPWVTGEKNIAVTKELDRLQRPYSEIYTK